MSVLANFDINNNFWEVNPGFKILGEFAKFYRKDTSKGKATSSKVMWAVAWFADVDSENRLKNFTEKDRKILISEEYIKEEKFNWKKYNVLIDYYRETQLSPSKRSLVFLRRKMEEREAFLVKTTYDLDNARDLDGIIANTDKIFSMISKLEQQIEKDESVGGGAVRGGRIESAGERKEI